MTIEEKVGQMLMVHFYGEEANCEAETLIHQAHIGGIIYYPWANGLSSPEQVLKLSTDLQHLAGKERLKIPLLISIDQEGGVVSRLKRGFTVFPSNGALGKTNLPEYSYSCALATGEELFAVGINMILGPVVDIATNPHNPIIGVRSFSSNPDTVIAHGSAALNGFRDANILSVIKHFPGHGDVTMDSHIHLPIVNKPSHKLWSEELAPFSALCNDTDAVMTAHLLLPALDPFRCATLSPIIIEGILREKMGFEGVIITDSLVMQGFLTNCPELKEASIRAIEAGCDLLILGGKQLLKDDGLELKTDEILEIYNGIVDAVKQRRISEERINSSVKRLLHMKHQKGLCRHSPTPAENLKEKMNKERHEELAKTIAGLALHSQKPNIDSPVDFTTQNVAVFAPSLIKSDLQMTSLLEIGKTTRSFFFETLSPTVEELIEAQRLIIWADAFIVCSYNAWNYEEQQHFIEVLLNSEKPVVVFVLRDPLDEDLVDKADVVITTSSPDSYSIQSAIDLITGSSYN